MTANERRYRLSGEIDMQTAPQLKADLDALVANDTHSVIVVDWDGLTFIDSSGVKVLLTAQAALESRGRHLCAEKVSRKILRVFQARRRSRVPQSDLRMTATHVERRATNAATGGDESRRRSRAGGKWLYDLRSGRPSRSTGNSFHELAPRLPDDHDSSRDWTRRGAILVLDNGDLNEVTWEQRRQNAVLAPVPGEGLYRG
jgi:stage II sporulation protein AA (anti-sigma F factor antagonist)